MTGDPPSPRRPRVLSTAHINEMMVGRARRACRPRSRYDTSPGRSARSASRADAPGSPRGHTATATPATPRAGEPTAAESAVVSTATGAGGPARLSPSAVWVGSATSCPCARLAAADEAWATSGCSYSTDSPADGRTATRTRSDAAGPSRGATGTAGTSPAPATPAAPGVGR